MSNKVEVTLPDGTKHVVDSVQVKPYKENPTKMYYLVRAHAGPDAIIRVPTKWHTEGGTSWGFRVTETAREGIILALENGVCYDIKNKTLAHYLSHWAELLRKMPDDN